jgi:hypothetical protein
MSVTLRRAAGGMLALSALVAIAVCSQQGDTPTYTFRITLGLTDKEPADWSGKLAVADGEVVELAGWRFEDKDAVDGKNGWKCSTRNFIAPDARFPQTNPVKAAPKAPEQPWPNGVTLTVRGQAPTVTLTLPGGEVKFKTNDVPLGDPKLFLDKQVRVERMPATTVLREAAAKVGDGVQDDYPAFWIRYRTNKHYLAWVAYQKEKDRVLLVERDGPDGKWSEPLEVDGPGDHFRVALATTHDDVLWIVWAGQREHRWNLFGRPYKDGKLGDVVQLSEASGPNLWHSMTTDQKGRAWLVWQSFRAKDGSTRADIYARCYDDGKWHDAVHVSTADADNWNPTIAADYKEDRVWVAWDSYESGDYNVKLRSLTAGPKPALGDVLTPEAATAFQAHPSVACDRGGRVWVAWDQSGSNWGKDTGFLYQKTTGTRLYQDRRVRVKCLVDGKWKEPEADLDKVLSADLKEYNELPQLQEDGEGRMWLAFRHRTCRRPRVDGWAIQARWDMYATACLGDRWTTPVELPQSGGRNDMRASSQRDRSGNVYFAHATDNRKWQLPNMPSGNLSLAVSRLGGAAKAGEFKLRDSAAPPKVAPIHANEAEQVARIRKQKIDFGGKTYHIYRGDLHRHTDISIDGMGDGSVMDLHRYALDAAALDFVLVGDHNAGQDQEYPWWRTQKANDLYTISGSFISMYGYERSVPYPNGHRNVIWPERGQRTLPVPPRANAKLMMEDTTKLYAYLKKTDGICTAHTSATDQGTNWEEFDGSLEPIVELFQGYHTSYEAPGAPKTTDDKTELVHGPYKPDGFISKALAKDYRLGFQSSSDHVSTHVSFACVLAEDFSRKGLIDAMKKRHTYAATDNIVMDVRMGTLGIMGDEVRTDKPGLDVVVLGTGPLERVDVLRDGEVVHTAKLDKNVAEARFHWDDPTPRKGEKASYYYVRVEQKDGAMAWASPIWVVAK